MASEVKKGISGKGFFLYVDDKSRGETPTWKLIGGQRAGGYSVKADDIDASHKTSGGWKTTIPGLKEWTADLDGIVLDKDEGIKLCEQTAFSGEERRFAFVYPDKTYRVGVATVTEFSIDAPHDDVITYKGSLKGVGPLGELQQTFTES